MVKAFVPITGYGYQARFNITNLLFTITKCSEKVKTRDLYYYKIG